jgi:hypothetical protein
MVNQFVARTFSVSDVEIAEKPLPGISPRKAISSFLNNKSIEACSQHAGLVQTYRSDHPLIGTLHTAFCKHYPVSLSPDTIWLTITQGLAQHINLNAEELRHHFVTHSGKATIKVRRDDFIKGSPENPWQEVFGEFSEQIRQYIGQSHDLIVANFSTTGAIERAASEIVLLDAMQAYFDYEFQTLCGIPEITLEGTVEDWQSIVQKFESFAKFGLDWWVEPLRPILYEFVAAASGNVNKEFWDSIYKYEGAKGSGFSPHVTGWVAKFFPYIGDSGSTRVKKRNPSLNSEEIKQLSLFPTMPSKAPFKWLYYDRTYNMEFVAGLLGISQNSKTLCLRPEIGWAVVEA